MKISIFTSFFAASATANIISRFMPRALIPYSALAARSSGAESTTSGPPVTTDGTCGANNSYTVCGNWPQGSCCSVYGFCGNTSAYCGDGCQSGPCTPSTQAPLASPAPANSRPGSFMVVGDSGVPAMGAALLPNGKVAFLDKIENYTKLTLPNGQYAYSSEYDPPATSNKTNTLAFRTNPFHCGGTFLKDGRLLSLGGSAALHDIDPTVGDGFSGIRYLQRSSTNPSFTGDWSEPGNKLNTNRSSPSVQTMPDGTVFVASGSLNNLDPTKNSNNNPTYEVLDAGGNTMGKSITMDMLAKNQPYFMYPFIHLLNDGTLFVFVSKSSQIFDVGNSKIVKQLDDLPGLYRTFPNTGGSVLLPMSSQNGWNADIVVCGGGAYQDLNSPTEASCGRIQPMTASAKWEMDSMNQGRTMGDGVLLPDGTVVWVNGANNGAQGYGEGNGEANNATLQALIYDPNASLGHRWTTGANTTIPRMYNSVAVLQLNGTVLIAGSNPNLQSHLQSTADQPYVTEFRTELYTPPNLSGDLVNRRPTQISLSNSNLKANSSSFNITFTAPANANTTKISLYHGGFVTHTVHMGHRMMFLDVAGFKPGQLAQNVQATMPPNNNIAPPGPYVVYVVVDGVPSIGKFVMVS